MTFSISALVSTRDSHIKPDSEAGGLIRVEGWYQGRYGKFHVIYLSHVLHWLFSSIEFYIAEKIFELTNCENKSLRELPLFNLQIFLFRVCTMTLDSICSYYWTCKHEHIATKYVIKIYTHIHLLYNYTICFSSFQYLDSFLTFWHSIIIYVYVSTYFISFYTLMIYCLTVYIYRLRLNIQDQILFRSGIVLAYNLSV